MRLPAMAESDGFPGILRRDSGACAAIGRVDVDRPAWSA